MTDDSLESVAAHGIRGGGRWGRGPGWSSAEPRVCGRLSAEGAVEGRRGAARGARRAGAAALSAVLLLSAAAGGGCMVLSARARTLESERAAAPLWLGADAVVLDTSCYTLEESVDEILARVRRKLG